jgi:hypothetical protein
MLDEASASSAERRAHARFAAEAETALNSSMVPGSSPWAFRRFRLIIYEVVQDTVRGEMKRRSIGSSGIARRIERIAPSMA